MHSMMRSGVLITIATIAASGCAGPLDTSLEKLLRARSLSADLLVQFATAADAGNRAVMAATDEGANAAAREAHGALEAVRKDIEALDPVLGELRYSAERKLLSEFSTRFAEYRTLNDSILGLAVENTNVKAQRLSFGSGQEASVAFQEALERVRQSAPAERRWQVEAIAARAVAAVRGIQVIQAPHIAEADDAAMTAMEKRMAAAEGTARAALVELAAIASPGARPQVTAAVAALDRFLAVNAEIVVLSRRNSNVRSLALSLGQKRVLAAQCEEALRALEDALAKRGLGGTR